MRSGSIAVIADDAAANIDAAGDGQGSRRSIDRNYRVARSGVSPTRQQTEDNTGKYTEAEAFPHKHHGSVLLARQQRV